jgi:uncharacterized membrane protein
MLMQYKFNFSYPVKLWLTSISTAPALFLTLEMSQYIFSNPVNYLTSVGAWVVTGAIFSVPALILYWLIYTLLQNASLKPLIRKLNLLAIAVTLEWTTFYWMYGYYIYNPGYGGNTDGVLFFLACYIIGLLIAHICFTLPERELEKNSRPI